MSDNDLAENAAEPASEAAREADAPRADAADEAKPPTPEERIAALEQQVHELRDKNLRLVAEAQNQQKRAQRERQDAVRFAEAEFARDLLVVLDDLDRTQDVVKAAEDVQSVADGVRIIHDHFLKVLGQHNIRPIEAVGKPFDPNVHEALMQQPSEEPAGTVIQEIARGYRMHERVIRPSRVVVSSGPGEVDEENSE
jgi:molecular chaperone GrpE